MSDSRSATPQCSQTSPSSSNRMMSMSCISTRLARRWDAHELTLVRRSGDHPSDRLVFGGDQVLDVEAHVGEGGEQHPEVVEHPVLRGGKARHLIVLHKVVSDQRGEAVEVSRADPFVGAPHRRRMVHRCPPVLRDEADQIDPTLERLLVVVADGTQRAAGATVRCMTQRQDEFLSGVGHRHRISFELIVDGSIRRSSYF